MEKGPRLQILPILLLCVSLTPGVALARGRGKSKIPRRAASDESSLALSADRPIVIEGARRQQDLSDVPLQSFQYGSAAANSETAGALAARALLSPLSDPPILVGPFDDLIPDPPRVPPRAPAGANPVEQNSSR